MDAEPSRARRAHSCHPIGDVGNDKPYRVAASMLLCRNTFGVGSDGGYYQGWAVPVPNLSWHTESVPRSPGEMICGFGFNLTLCQNCQSSDGDGPGP